MLYLRVLFLLTFLCLSACGQKGPLYLPQAESSPFTSSVVSHS